MNLEQFEAKLNGIAITAMGNGIAAKDVEVLITKSSGETLIALMHNDEVVDYFKVV